MIASELDALLVDGDPEAFEFLMGLFSLVRTLRTDRVISAGRARCGRDAEAVQDVGGRAKRDHVLTSR